MAHAFDTGLARAQRTLIRDGVVTLLSPLLRANGGYLAGVIPFGGVVRGYTDEVGIDLLKAALNGRAPSIAIGLGDRSSESAGVGGFNFKATLELVLYHYANHGRSLTEGRTKIDAAAIASDVADPGLDVMLEHAEELVLGQLVGGALAQNVVGEKTHRALTIHRIVPTREEELATEAGVTLWAQRYNIMVTRTINPARGVSQMIEEIRTIVRPSDAAAAELDPPEVVELQNTTPDYVEPPPEEP